MSLVLRRSRDRGQGRGPGVRSRPPERTLMIAHGDSSGTRRARPAHDGCCGEAEGLYRRRPSASRPSCAASGRRWRQSASRAERPITSVALALSSKRPSHFRTVERALPGLVDNRAWRVATRPACSNSPWRSPRRRRAGGRDHPVRARSCSARRWRAAVQRRLPTEAAHHRGRAKPWTSERAATARACELPAEQPAPEVLVARGSDDHGPSHSLSGRNLRWPTGP
jgi:hypothetical protein